jgi:hypothetical protein
VAGKAETGDVGDGAGAMEEGEARASAFERSISTSAGSRPAASIRSNLKALTSAPLPSGLVRISRSPGRAPWFVNRRSGIAVADDRQPELELLVADRVAAQDRRAGRAAGGGAAGEDPGEDRGRRVGREAAEIEREERASAHGVDVRDGVGRGDPAEAERIVADRRDEIGRRDERLAAEEHHAGVVQGLGPDQHARFGIGEVDRPPSPPNPSIPPSMARRSPGPIFAAQPPAEAGLREAVQGDGRKSRAWRVSGERLQRLGAAPDVGDDLQVMVGVDARESGDPGAP